MIIADADIVSPAIGTLGVRAWSDDLGQLLSSRDTAMFGAIKSLLKPGDVVIDAGASIGVISIFAARRVGPRGRVIAVEMLPDTARCLRRNIGLNQLKNVEVVEQALTSESGDPIKASVRLGLFGQASIALPRPATGSKTVEVETTTIDVLATGLMEIALLKLDLEGAERAALEGARETLQHVRAIIFESWDGGMNLSAWLMERGFSISRIDARNFLARRIDSMPQMVL